MTHLARECPPQPALGGDNSVALHYQVDRLRSISCTPHHASRTPLSQIKTIAGAATKSLSLSASPKKPAATAIGTDNAASCHWALDKVLTLSVALYGVHRHPA